MGKYLITGITGFAGPHLAQLLLKEGHEVHGLIRATSGRETDLLDLLNCYEFEQIKFQYSDLLNIVKLMKIIGDERYDGIYHMAAQSHPGQSFSDPISTFQDNVIGTVHLVECITRFSPETKFMLCCHDEKTRLYTTNRGLINYNEINLTDKVLSIDIETNEVKETNVIQSYNYFYEGEMYEGKYGYNDFLVTPNHKMLLRPYTGGNFELSEIKSLRIKHYKHAIGKWEGNDISKYKIYQKYKSVFDKYKIDDLMLLMGLYLGDGHSSKTLKKTKNKSGLNRGDYLKASKDSTTGRFVKMGKIGNNDITESIGYRIFLSIPKEKRCRQLAIELLNRMNIKHSDYDSEIYFSENDLYPFLREVGVGALNKQIPSWILDLSPDNLIHLFKGMMLTDGTGMGIVRRYFTSSIRLMETFCELCLKLGMLPTVRKRKSNGSYIDGRLIKGVVSYVITIKSRHPRMSKDRLNVVKYKGTVWCIETKYKNFLVERNGRYFYSGNSTSEVYGDQCKDIGMLTEETPIKPCNPYGVSKASIDLYVQERMKNGFLKGFITRAFSHTGPRRFKNFSISSDAYQIAQIAKGIRKLPLHIGNLDTERVVIDVRDTVRAYYLLMEKCHDRIIDTSNGDVYNVCGTTVRKMRYFTEKLIEISGLKNIQMVKYVPFYRKIDIQVQVGDSSKLIALTGWKPEIPIDKTLKDLYEYWLKKV